MWKISTSTDFVVTVDVENFHINSFDDFGCDDMNSPVLNALSTIYDCSEMP
jgi:hypothetical protein